MDSDEEAFASPYDILGIDQNATMGHIKYAYRELIKTIHPDKKGNTDSYFDKLNDEERTTLFSMVHKAYETLKSQRGTHSDMPTEDIDYNADDMDTDELEGFENIRISEFNEYTHSEEYKKFIQEQNEKFNLLFEKEKRNTTDEDPNCIGNKDFNSKTNLTDYNSILKNYNYKGVEENKIENEVYIVNSRPFQLNPKSYEFGLTKIDDYSITMNDNLEGSDINLAHNNTIVDDLGTLQINKFGKDLDEKVYKRIKERKMHLPFLSTEEEMKRKIDTDRLDQIKYRVQGIRDAGNYRISPN
jgi:curved DNA-binding protein CbpA